MFKYLILLLLSLSPVFAERIDFVNGRSMFGNIVAETKDSITVEIPYVSLDVFSKKDIKNIVRSPASEMKGVDFDENVEVSKYLIQYTEKYAEQKRSKQDLSNEIQAIEKRISELTRRYPYTTYDTVINYCKKIMDVKEIDTLISFYMGYLWKEKSIVSLYVWYNEINNIKEKNEIHHATMKAITVKIQELRGKI